MFFNKPKAKYNFLNDKDDDVYNVFRQLLDNKEELVYWLSIVPITEIQFKKWSSGEKENSPVMNAVRFLVLSNYGFYGTTGSLRGAACNVIEIILQNIDLTFKYLSDAMFYNVDFRDLFKKIDTRTIQGNSFCYADPPYLASVDNYSDSFNQQDSIDLFDTLQNINMRFAMSEFDNPFILQQAAERKLNVIYVCERRNLGNRRTEILVTNYKTNPTLF